MTTPITITLTHEQWAGLEAWLSTPFGPSTSPSMRAVAEKLVAARRERQARFREAL